MQIDDLERHAERYLSLFHSIDQGFCVVEVLFDDNAKAVDYRFLEVNDAFARQTGLANALNRTMRSLAPEHEEFWFEIYGRIALSGKPERFEMPAEALGRYFDVSAFRVGRPDERTVGVLFDDITDRKRIEHEHDLVMQEMGHRVRNAFALVQALATQTARSASSVDHFLDGFVERLQGLARSHSLILDQHMQSADLKDLVLQSIEGYHTSAPGRVVVQGESVVLPARQVLGLGLALHELGTNAAKYGALSGAHGRVDIAWKTISTSGVDGLRLSWREHTIHTVTPPTRRGFGTKLIERICTQELHGECEMEYGPHGLSVSMSFPLDFERRI